MKLTLSDAKYLKEPIMIISELVNEATFRIDKDKIELIAMDPANVSMVIFKLLSSAFVEYDVKEPLEISLNLDNLKQVLKRANANVIIIFELLENKLKIELKSDTKRTVSLYSDQDKFSLEALGSLTTAKIELIKDDKTLIESKDKVKSKYSVEYLKKIVKGSKLADRVVLQFSKDYPLKASYKVTDKMLLEFILAPRVAND